MNKAPRTASLVYLTLASPLLAQWSHNPSLNMAVANSLSEQAQPLVVSRADGGSYVSWFDSDPSGKPAYGYDVRLQRLDSSGRKQWASGGLLVADRGFSSTQAYGLDIDVLGRAALAFRDDRVSGTQITAALVDAKGTLPWGTKGIQLTNTTAFVATPKIAATSDLHYVVAWTEGNAVHVQKLKPSGATAWSAVKVLTATSANLSLCDLHASSSGSVIVSMKRDTGFRTPAHIYAQKLDATGKLLWGANHVAVFNTGSLQLGNYPSFLPDGAGGAVFAWYTSSPALECYAQRVSAAGTVVFKANGVAVSTNTTNVRTAPNASYDPVTQSLVLAYRELTASQSKAGVSAQKLDKSGNRLWTATGKSIVPIGTASIADVNSLAITGGSMVFWTSAPAWAQDQVYCTVLDTTGKTLVNPFSVSSKVATKYRVQAALSTLGFAILAWQDDRAGNADIYAQDVFSDGRLGLVANAKTRNGSNVNPNSFTALTTPVIGTNWESSIALPTGASMSGVFFSPSSIPGTTVPAFGEVLIAFPTIYLNTVASSGTADKHIVPVPKDLSLVGIKLYTQAVTAAGSKLQFCNALDIKIGI